MQFIPVVQLIFQILWWTECSKKQNLFEIDTFRNFINVDCNLSTIECVLPKYNSFLQIKYYYCPQTVLCYIFPHNSLLISPLQLYLSAAAQAQRAPRPHHQRCTARHHCWSRSQHGDTLSWGDKPPCSTVHNLGLERMQIKYRLTHCC